MTEVNGGNKVSGVGVSVPSPSPKEEVIGGRKYTELPPLPSRPLAEEARPAEVKEVQKDSKPQRAAELIKELSSFELVIDGVNKPLSLISDPQVAATIATSQQLTTIRESLQLLGRYKEPLSGMVLPEKWTPDNSPAALNVLQKEYKVENGNSGYRFGDQTRNALVSELSKLVAGSDNVNP